jgi:hypothetical protein
MGVEALKMALDGNWNSRQFVGGAIVFTTLAGVGEFAPQPAAAFAVLIMVAVLLKDGVPVITKLMGPGTPATTKTTPTTGAKK